MAAAAQVAVQGGGQRIPLLPEVSGFQAAELPGLRKAAILIVGDFLIVDQRRMTFDHRSQHRHVVGLAFEGVREKHVGPVVAQKVRDERRLAVPGVGSDESDGSTVIRAESLGEPRPL